MGDGCRYGRHRAEVSECVKKGMMDLCLCRKLWAGGASQVLFFFFWNKYFPWTALERYAEEMLSFRGNGPSLMGCVSEKPSRLKDKPPGLSLSSTWVQTFSVWVELLYSVEKISLSTTWPMFLVSFLSYLLHESFQSVICCNCAMLLSSDWLK